jgi:RHH-type transcriptional regulator, rel operon repressor / antitoxin RelB
MLAIRLEKDIEDRLTMLALKTGRTKTFYVREAILEHLGKLEDTHFGLEHLTAAAWGYSPAEVRRGGSLSNTGRNQQAVRRRLHAPDGRASAWLDRSPAERVEALEEIRMAAPNSLYDQQAFPRFSRVTRKAQS